LNIKHLTGGYEVQDAEFPCSIDRLREEEVVADSCSQTSHRRAEIWPESNCAKATLVAKKNSIVFIDSLQNSCRAI
jgi:hypothetical protein